MDPTSLEGAGEPTAVGGEPRPDDGWEATQSRLADLPGEAGIALRRKEYRRFFLRLADDVRIDAGCHFTHPERIAIDSDARINRGALVYGSGGVRIGRHARIGPRLFLHSANHDIDPGAPEAFFERGYVAAPVTIGDNVLVSADVRILPGCSLGDGSFVAAGATVTGRQHPAGSRLAGCPARAMGGRAEAPRREPLAPDVVIMVADGDLGRRSLWQHILTCLGLPQVGVREVHEGLPAGARSVILDHGVVMAPEGHPEPACWRVRAGDAPSAGIEFALADGTAVTLPAEVRARTRPRIEESASSAERARFVALWLRDRLTKRTEPLPANDVADWLVTLHALRVPPSRSDRLLERVIDALSRRWPIELADLRPVRPPDTEGDLRRLVAAVMDRLAGDDEASAPKARLANLRKRCLQVPALLVHRALAGDAEATDLVRQVAPHCNTGHRLAALEIASRLIDGSGGLVAELCGQLGSREWRSDVPCVPRAAAASPRPLLSPLVIALWLLRDPAAAEGAPEEGILDESEQVRPLRWTPFEDSAGSARWTLSCADRKVISAGLIDAWEALHGTSLPSGQQLFLDAGGYVAAIRGAEAALLDAFGKVFAGAGIPMARLAPWPAPHRHALALRFDVDRPVSAGEVRALVSLQARRLNAPCGSWYLGPGDPRRDEVSRLLRSFLQEVGLHLRSEADAERGLGVTMHSSPEAAYWSGQRTVSALSDRGAGYGEHLAACFDVPRPALDADGALWLTPLHFPLEGGTADGSLDYFDRLLPQFRDRIASGGLAIVGTHPDVAGPLLEQLTAREGLADAWCTTVAQAVQRTRKVMAHGAIRGRTVPGGIELACDECVADLALTVRMPDGSTRRSVTQLQAGVPRTVRHDP
jgi:acetyltransferase-like isoleucine patch superfamily enzyme